MSSFEPIRTPNCNLLLTLPGCSDLPCWRRCDNGIWTVTSYWKPDQEALLCLNAGMPLVLSFLGDTHPPILVRAGDDA